MYPRSQLPSALNIRRKTEESKNFLQRLKETCLHIFCRINDGKFDTEKIGRIPFDALVDRDFAFSRDIIILMNKERAG